MRFRHFDALQVFRATARCGSFSTAADELNLTKGAISYQIKVLEQELGFSVFHRLPRGISLTPKGQELLATVMSMYSEVEHKITKLRSDTAQTLTIGVSTYFASRWLSPRLMDFMQLHPDIQLRIQPMINFQDLKNRGIDLAIRWGKGDWAEKVITPLFSCPAFPVGNEAAAKKIQAQGIERAFQNFTLLKDREKSNAWAEWFGRANLPFHGQSNSLIIPDPNVRVQAVIDGQGVALNDELIAPEMSSKTLCKLSEIELTDYGYFLVYPNSASINPCAEFFIEWLMDIVSRKLGAIQFR